MSLLVNDTEELGGGSSTISLAEPSGLAAGELMLGFLMNIDMTGTPDMPPTPTGFTSDNADTFSVGAFKTIHRLADGSESGPYTSVIPGDGVYRAGKMLRIFGVHPSSPIDGTGDNSGTSSTVTLGSVTATDGPSLAVVWVVAAGQSITSTPSGWTVYDLYDGDGAGIFYRWVPDGAASGAATCTLAGSADWYTSTVLVRPDPARPALAWLASELGTSLGSTNAQPLGTGAAAGDLAVYFVVNDNPSTTNLSASTGWASATQQTQGSNVIKGQVFARLLTGTSGDNILSITGAAQDYSVIGLGIRNHGLADQSAVSTWLGSSSVAGTTNTSGNADPPNANPASSKDYLGLAFAAIDATNSGSANAISAVPSGWGQVGDQVMSASSTSSCTARAAAMPVTASSLNPGTFTNSSRGWLAYTLLVPPAVTAADVSGTPGVSLSTSSTANVSGSSAISGTAGVSTSVSATANITSEVVAPAAPTLTPGVGSLDVDFSAPAADQVDLRWRRADDSYLPSITTQSSAPWHLARIDGEGDSDYAQRFTGAGVVIYNVDSGVNGDHDEFEGRVLAGWTGSGQNGEPAWGSSGGTDPWTDQVPHGTGTAAAAAGAYNGVAKDATIYPLKVGGLWTGTSEGLTEDIFTIPPSPGSAHEGTEGLTIDVLEGAYQQILAHYLTLPPGTRALVTDSSSARTYATTTPPTTGEAARLEAAVQACVDAGIPVYCMAENFDQGIDHVPAIMADTICVGGINEDDERYIVTPGIKGSNFGPEVDLFAPARLNPAVGPPSHIDDEDYDPDAVGYGTSTSTPVAAGCGALLLEENPHITPARLKNVQQSQAFAGQIDLVGATDTVNLIVNSLSTTSAWTTVSGISDGYDLDGLEPGIEYEVQVRQTIDGDTSDWSSTATETTNEDSTEVSGTAGVSLSSSTTASIQGHAAISGTAGASTSTSATANVGGQADITGTAGTSVTTSSTADVGSAVVVSGTPGVSTSTSATGNVGAQADISGTAGASTSTSATAAIAGQADISGTSGSSTSTSATASIQGTANISGTAGTSTSTSGTAGISAQADISGTAGVSLSVSDVGQIGTSSGVDGTPGISTTTSSTAAITATANVSGTGATSLSESAVAQITTSTTVTGTPGTSTSVSSVADITGTVTISGTPGVSSSSSATAAITATANVTPTGGTSSGVSDIADIEEILVLPIESFTSQGSGSLSIDGDSDGLSITPLTSAGLEVH